MIFLIFILIAHGATKLITYVKHSSIKKAIQAVIFLLLLTRSVKTVDRNTKWLSGKSLYTEALKLDKYDGLMYSNLGYSLEDTSPHLAEDAHRLAVELMPNYSQPFRNYGTLLMKQHRYNEAEQVSLIYRSFHIDHAFNNPVKNWNIEMHTRRHGYEGLVYMQHGLANINGQL